MTNKHNVSRPGLYTPASEKSRLLDEAGIQASTLDVTDKKAKI